ncbi:MAG: CatB-related O-acetyltransferase [Alphaproteobacteria bacterium]|nr:CatB-related O-acetyltransferase [Alphaproteobacteria bacterium]
MTLKLFTPAISHIGKQSYSGNDLYVANPQETVIGSFVSIGCGVRIGHGTHPLSYVSTSPYLYLDRLEYKTNDTLSHNEWELLPPVHIGNDVWIGDYAWIKNGITVGDGAIVGAHSVVTRDVPPYAIVVGNPAKILKYRFLPDIIKDLLRLKWWELPDELIKTLPYDDIKSTIERLKELRHET